MAFTEYQLSRSAVAILALIIGARADAADSFTLNFMPQVNPPVVTGGCVANFPDCTLQGGGVINGGSSLGNDGSRFLQERLLIDGVAYFHVIVGDPVSGFATESYTTASTNAGIASKVNQAGTATDHRNYSPSGGGNERSVLGSRQTLNLTDQVTGGRQLFGNAKDPSGVLSYTDVNGDPAAPYRVTGTGTMDPTRVVMRMVVSDADMSLEVTKPLLTNKPAISQTTSDNTMSGKFVADMRGLSYDDLNRAAPVVNQLAIQDANLPAKGVGNFDLSMAQRSNITAGTFTFTRGQGWIDITTGAQLDGWDYDNSTFGLGTYTYADGSFDVVNIPWAKFFDRDQNLQYCSTGTRGGFGICP